MGSTSYQVQQLLEKATSGDPDFRIMFLQDVKRKAQEASFSLDDTTETKLVEQVLNMFNDNNSEVKSLAASTISTLVPKVKEDRVQKIIEKLTVMTSAKDDALRDVASLGLKTVVKEISPESKLAVTACNKLAPKLVAQLKNTSSSQDLLIQLIEVLGDIYARFESTIRASAESQSEGLAGLTPLLNDSRGAVRKRATRALGNLVVCSGDATFSNLLEKNALPALADVEDVEQTKTAISLIGVLAVSSPRKTGKRVADILPNVLKATQSEDDELKEVALQTVELLLLKCPTETSNFMPRIIESAAELVKYDPNYAANDDDMDDDNASDLDEEDADGDEDFEDDYEDDDDVSWKVRRAAVKVLSMAIQTRLNMLGAFYQSIAPVLITRFGEREETVRLEVWNTYTTLLKQTSVWSGNLPATIPVASTSAENSDTSRPSSPAISLKRKRDVQTQGADSPVAQLSSQASSVAKAILKQLASTKSLAVRIAGFQLLYQLTQVLQGGLESNIAALVPVVESVLKSGDQPQHHATSAGGYLTNLRIQVFRFLAQMFQTQHLKSISPHLGNLVPLIVNAMGDKSPKVAAAAFNAATELVNALLPASPTVASPASSSSTSAFIEQVYAATIKSLSVSTADQEVRQMGIVCLGDLIVRAYSDLGEHLDSGLKILQERLRNENTTLVSLIALGKIAESEGAIKNTELNTFLQESAYEVGEYLRKSNKPIQAASFVCLEALLRRIGASLPTDACEALIANLQPAIANPDIHLARALSCLSAIVAAHPNAVSKVQETILPGILALVAAPSQLTGGASDALNKFIASYVHAGADTLGLVKSLLAQAKTANALQVSVTASRCIGAAHRRISDTDSKLAEAIVGEASKLVTGAKASDAQLCLGFLSIGEIGRHYNLSSHQNVFTIALKNLSASAEEVRSSAAFAIGNMAAGAPSAFMTAVLKEIQTSEKDDRRMHLLLSSVKEILTHTSSDAIAGLSSTLWTPLFQLCENAAAQQKAAGTQPDAGSSARAGDEARLDSTRNIAAECLGKITLTNPAEYLGQLHARIGTQSAGTRAAVITAIRFTFTDGSPAYDDLLAPLIVQFLSLMQDEDLTVRRLAVSSLTSAAHNKPYLIRDHLAVLQPLLYEQTKPNPALIHEITMGPFKVKVDNGLSTRKAAYQCMYTLLDTCLNKLDIDLFLERLTAGLGDDDDIKVQSYLMLVKLSLVATTAVVTGLDNTVKPFDAVLKTKLKETAVKQEIERLAEMQRSVLRTLVPLLPLASKSATPRFVQFVDELKTSSLYGAELRNLITAAEQNRTQAGTSDRMDLD